MKEIDVMDALAVCSMMAEMEEGEFEPIICMTLEEWCLKHDRDIIEVAEDLLTVIKKVNAEMGKYKKEGVA